MTNIDDFMIYVGYIKPYWQRSRVGLTEEQIDEITST